jgi:hypothetical protein
MTKETFHLGTIKIAMDGTSGYFGPTILDKYATHLSELKDCGAPLLEESPNYLASFVLNRTFTNPLPDPQGGTLFLFGRRILHAANEYKLGRDWLTCKNYLTRIPTSCRPRSRQRTLNNVSHLHSRHPLSLVHWSL